MKTIILVPINRGVGLNSLADNLVKNLNYPKIGLMKTISKEADDVAAVSFNEAENMMANNLTDVLLEKIFVAHREFAKDKNIVILEGVVPCAKRSYANQLNAQITLALDAQILFVASPLGDDAENVKNRVEACASSFGGKSNANILGVIITKMNEPDLQGRTVNQQTAKDFEKVFANSPIKLLANFDYNDPDALNQMPVNLTQAIIAPTNRSAKLSPANFRVNLTEKAIAAKKRIVLPEGDEPRTVKAAVLCAERGIAECVLLAEPINVEKIAKEQGINLCDGITIINPVEAQGKYVARLVELRANKGMTEKLAREQLEDNVVLGTMMLEAGEVDGLVSGAIHTTANTIRPPMQIIKTAPGSSIISSIFFMLLPDQVLVYGDCAVNPDPTAEQLADIAIQSADSAKAFGIDPKVAMISYSTINSGAGVAVDKVKEATRIAQEKRPDLLIDGPLQYDAAVMPDVAASKAPNSKVAGQATVFIFPELSTGNALYKAVQRSANVLSIGPMLQGMRKPVNDLSRGALVEDIVYTIALTAIQAIQ